MSIIKYRIQRISPIALSVSALTADDIAPADEAYERQKKIFSAVRLILIVVFFTILIFSTASIIKTLVNYKKADDLYSELKNEFYDGYTNDGLPSVDTVPLPSPGDDSQGTEDATDTTVQMLSARVSALKSTNSDIIGWISIPGTEIDYPVLLGEDNEYYLNHNYKNGYLPAGAIFADCNSDADVSKNRNLVLFGHNMKNGMMFNGITEYLDEDFFNSGNDIYIYTTAGMYVFKVFSAYQTVADSGYIKNNFSSDEEFQSFIDKAVESSKFPSPSQPAVTDTLLTLSTCTNGAANGRYCVAAYLSQTII